MSDSTRRGLMISQGVAMVVVGLVVLFLRATMTIGLFTLLGTVLSLLLIAASLLFIAITDVLSSIGLDARQIPHLRHLLIATAFAAAAGVFVILLGPMTIRSACCLLAVYSLILSIGKAHLARHWAGTRQAQAVLFLLAGVALLFSGLLATVAMLAKDERVAFVLIAAYAIYMGLQMLLTMYYVHGRAAVALRRAV
ncbi:MAG TPA: hypothetical protein VHX37_16495 [Acidobacteriaceae bacterium]|jgi:hypothetical protein|nr:hypothetical protein [Acidobacteriaceae bacterium]